ncbi:hypothetical protein FOA52_007483 [Chlamydomonas sp. UWO 241]|nr:hypothetical protein FOA52_007483 [Chlamydomonas sp. UWO 241]
MDVIKTRLQLDTSGKYTGIVQCGKTIIHEEGTRALWKGLTPFATHLTLKYALRMFSNSVYQNLLRDKDGKLSTGARMGAGFMAGITEALVIVTPFEVVKIRLQQQRGCSMTTQKYKGPVHCAVTTLREEGIRGLWSGATPTIMRNGTNQMCLFWAKSHMDTLLWDKHEGDGKHLTPTQSMASGGLAAILGPVATGPFDVVKTRLMAQSKAGELKYKGFFDALTKIPKEEGLKVLWKGLLPRLLRIPPGQPSGDNNKGNEPDPRLQRLRSFMLGIGMPGMGMVNPSLLSGGMPSMPGGRAMQDRPPARVSKPAPPSQPADPWAGPARQPGLPEEWGRSAWEQDWDPAENLNDDDLDVIADEAEEEFRRGGRGTGPPRDKWITPLLDFQSVSGAVDPDQERTEDTIQGEALANKDESQRALRYVATLIGVPLATGFIVSRALADPVLNFTLQTHTQNNEDAFAMNDLQKVEGARALHVEETRLRLDAAIGKAPPLNAEHMLEHMREFATEFEEEERHHNEQNLITVVSDSVSGIMLFALLVQQSRGRTAMFNLINRLFEGLSDIAKAVMIILIVNARSLFEGLLFEGLSDIAKAVMIIRIVDTLHAHARSLFEGLSDIAKAVMIILIVDTLLGYHSEEGWTGLLEIICGHYGLEAEEEGVVIFVGVVPVVIDVCFKYWIFVGLNKISPGAVVTIKQIDTH